MTEPAPGVPSPADPARPGPEGEALPPLPEPLPYVVGTPPGLPPLDGVPAFDPDGNEIPAESWETYRTTPTPREITDADTHEPR